MNNTRFFKNPIAVRDGERLYKIIEFSKEIINDDFKKLAIETPNGHVIKTFEVDENSLISIDRKLGEIKLVYMTEDGTELGSEIVDLMAPDRVEAEPEPEEVILYKKIKKYVQREMDNPEGTPAEVAFHTEQLKNAPVDVKAKKYVTAKIRKIVSSFGNISNEDIEDYVKRIYADLYGMGVLQELDESQEVGEIMVNAVTFPAFHCDIYYIVNQRKYKYDKTFETFMDMYNVFSRVIAFEGKELNSIENALIETSRPNRDRVNIIIPDASDNYCLNIRKFTNFVPDKNMMKKSGTVNEEIETVLGVLVDGKANIGVGGPMGTGKTTFVNYLLGYTPPMERKVVIASVSETDVDRVLKGHDVLIFNVKEEFGFTFSALVRASLRTTADRVIIPESRGGEFKDLYEANLKTKGNMFTAHAIDDYSFLDMCVDMYMSSPEAGEADPNFIRNKICKGVDIIIMMTRINGPDGAKIRIKHISEICVNANQEFSHMNRLVEWVINEDNPSEGYYSGTGNTISDGLKSRLIGFGVNKKRIEEMNEALMRMSPYKDRPLIAGGEKPK